VSTRYARVAVPELKDVVAKYNITTLWHHDGRTDLFGSATSELHAPVQEVHGRRGRVVELDPLANIIGDSHRVDHHFVDDQLLRHPDLGWGSAW
jgi:hypothetical protein